MRGSVVAYPTSFGTEEVVDVIVALDPNLDELQARATAALERAARDAFVLFAVVVARPGRQDLMRRPVLPHQPVPLAVLIGPPGLRDLKVDLASFFAALALFASDGRVYRASC